MCQSYNSSPISQRRHQHWHLHPTHNRQRRTSQSRLQDRAQIQVNTFNLAKNLQPPQKCRGITGERAKQSISTAVDGVRTRLEPAAHGGGEAGLFEERRLLCKRAALQRRASWPGARLLLIDRILQRTNRKQLQQHHLRSGKAHGTRAVS